MSTILGHVAPGTRDPHHWVYQILAIVIILGIWVAIAGYAERRRTRQGDGAAVPDDPISGDGRTGPESHPYVPRPSGRVRRSPKHRVSRR